MFESVFVSLMSVRREEEYLLQACEYRISPPMCAFCIFFAFSGGWRLSNAPRRRRILIDGENLHVFRILASWKANLILIAYLIEFEDQRKGWRRVPGKSYFRFRLSLENCNKHVFILSSSNP